MLVYCRVVVEKDDLPWEAAGLLNSFQAILFKDLEIKLMTNTP
jgi:hypothetical protein